MQSIRIRIECGTNSCIFNTHIFILVRYLLVLLLSLLDTMLIFIPAGELRETELMALHFVLTKFIALF